MPIIPAGSLFPGRQALTTRSANFAVIAANKRTSQEKKEANADARSFENAINPAIRTPVA